MPSCQSRRSFFFFSSSFSDLFRQAQQYAAPSYESQGFLYDARAVPVAAGPEALAPQHEGHQQQQLVPAAHQPLHPSLYVAALVLGMLSFVLFWPLSFVGLGLAWRAMKKIGCDRTHPNYAVVRAAVILNMVALVLGIVLTVVAIAVVGVEWVLLQRAHSYRLVQTAVVEGSKRMALR